MYCMGTTTAKKTKTCQHIVKLTKYGTSAAATTTQNKTKQNKTSYTIILHVFGAYVYFDVHICRPDSVPAYGHVYA